MYKVKQIADGMIIWKGNAVIGIKGLTLPKMFDDCDCFKLPGNAFDYSLSPHNEYTQEQLDYIKSSEAEWCADEESEEFDDDLKGPCPTLGDHYWDSDDLPF